MSPPRLPHGDDARVLLICDHASNLVPSGIDLGVARPAMDSHIAWDIGAGAVTEAAAGTLNCRAVLATVSRLVVDANRPPELAVPQESDGTLIRGNIGLTDGQLKERLAIHDQFHAAIEAAVRRRPPQLLVSVHSFTPALATAPALRPWPIAILWNKDARAANIALAALAAEPGLIGPVGANEPYSGRVLNYTMDRHAEAAGIAYLGFEIRQDLIADGAGALSFADIVVRTVRTTLEQL